MTQTGFYECQATCNPGLCCLPSAVNEVSGLDGTPPEVKECRSTHEDICQYYTPCESLAGLNHNHGSPVDLVNLKCSPHNLMFAEGKEDCENVCETRVCCFAGSKYNNCRDDNEVCINVMHHSHIRSYLLLIRTYVVLNDANRITGMVRRFFCVRPVAGGSK